MRITGVVVAIALLFISLLLVCVFAYPHRRGDRWVAVPAIERPSYLAPVVVAEFGTQITRIAEDDSYHHYAKDQTWNSNQNLIKLNHGQQIDGKIFILFGVLPVSSESMWSTREPKEMQIKSSVRPEPVEGLSQRSDCV